jgi:hypothetical protein
VPPGYYSHSTSLNTNLFYKFDGDFVVFVYVFSEKNVTETSSLVIVKESILSFYYILLVATLSATKLRLHFRLDCISGIFNRVSIV